MKIALVVKNKPGSYRREDKGAGYFSYAVPEFEWENMSLGDYFIMDVDPMEFDVLIQEDGGNWGTYKGAKPKLMLVVDSTLSEEHYQGRVKHATQFDWILVDHDKLERFRGNKISRFSYCVNDKVFHDRGLERDIDINFHCATHGPGTGARTLIRQLLGDWSKNGRKYVSGAVGLEGYSLDMARSKIVVNWPRTPINRPHRTFDVMASGACLVTGVLPGVSDEERTPGVHYVEVAEWEDIPKVCDQLLESGDWAKYAKAGNELAMRSYTWAVRAKELRELLRKEFGI